MRNLITVVVVLAIMLVPGALLAGDTVHHGHGMRSGWDSQTGDGFQGSEYVGEIRDFYRVYPDARYNRGYYPGYPPYANSGLSVTYSDGNWGASFSYSNQRILYYYPNVNHYPPVCGNYACSGNCTSCLNRYQPRYNQAQMGYPPLQPAYYYSSPNYQQYPAPIYSAPPNPDLGYYAQPSQNYQQQPQVVNIYNYYGSEFDQQPETAPQPTGSPVNQNTVQSGSTGSYDAAPPVQATQDTPVGTRFYSSARLSSSNTTMLFSLENGRLFAGSDNGPPQLVAEGIDESTGVLAAWQPGLGYSLIYRIGDAVIAAWTSGSIWYEDPLPEFVDFSSEVTIGMVGGSPWVVFNGFDGSRHIYSFAAGWLKLGRATQSPATD